MSAENAIQWAAMKALENMIFALEARVAKLEREAEAKRTEQNVVPEVRQYDHADPWDYEGKSRGPMGD